MNMQHAKLMKAMTAYDRGAVGRIQHFVKVYGLASTIGMLEGLDPEEQFVLETAAIVHDIGIKITKRNMVTAMERTRRSKDRLRLIKCSENWADTQKRR